MASKPKAKAAPAEATSTEAVVNIDGTTHVISALPVMVQQAITTLNAWNVEIATAEGRVLQLRHAIQSLSNEIVKAVKESAATDA